MLLPGPTIAFVALFAALVGLFVVDRGVVLTARSERAAMAASYDRAPDGMVLIPAGRVWRGSASPLASHDEGALRQEFLGAFYIDRYEVTHAEYQAVFPGHRIPKGRADFPVTKVTRADAEAYAAAVGKRLPTAAEWERAARGNDAREYPWGDAFEAGRANLGAIGALTTVGSYPEGVSIFGVHDMTGNAWEWVADTYRDDVVLGTSAVERGIIKGGAYAYAPFQGRIAYNGFEHPTTTCGDLSFRCAKDARPIEGKQLASN